MKVVILAGGIGSRLAEETQIKPKPMIEIGGRPILWHIMKHYSYYGHKEFIIALGYKGEEIKHFFMDYATFNNSLTVDLCKAKVQMHTNDSEDWIVHLIDTGVNTQTGGRLKRLQPWLEDGAFMITYGDGVSNVDLNMLLKFHQAQKRIGTMTVVRPPARFGSVSFNGDLVSKFTEKPQIGEGWINGGFFVFEPEIFNYLEGDKTILEAHSLEKLAEDRQLAAYRHEKFWQCMDTLRDKNLLENLWQKGNAPWRVWS
ncbi:MAG: glucose-1-phosphate cytidylyltransferase [Thermodesulfobacteriota bacterium]|jgi:glucose-1-phosphate cytidylyltransferase